jgi:hypothetical protein
MGEPGDVDGAIGSLSRNPRTPRWKHEARIPFSSMRRTAWCPGTMGDLRGGEFALDDVEVGAAHPAGTHRHQHLDGGRLRFGHSATHKGLDSAGAGDTSSQAFIR